MSAIFLEASWEDLCPIGHGLGGPWGMLFQGFIALAGKVKMEASCRREHQNEGRGRLLSRCFLVLILDIDCDSLLCRFWVPFWTHLEPCWDQFEPFGRHWGELLTASFLSDFQLEQQILRTQFGGG